MDFWWHSTLFQIVDLKKGLKLQLSPVGKMYLVYALMQNARNCMYGNGTTFYFDLKPVAIEYYFL